MKIKKELYDRISNTTMTDYEGKILDDEYYYIDEYGIESMFEDMFCEINNIEERKDDEIQQLQYKIEEMHDHNMW